MDQSTGMHTQALGYLDTSLTDDEYHAVQWKEQGDAHFAASELKAAVAAYEKALQLRPEFAEACNNLGAVLQHLGEDVRAESFLQRALRLLPVAAVYNNLGSALIGQGKPKEAVTIFGRALKLERDNAQIVFNLGAAWHDLGELDKAIRCYREAIRLQADYVGALINLATAVKEQGLLDEAVRLLRHILTIRPNDALAYCNLSEMVEGGFARFTAEELERMKAIESSEQASPLSRSLCGFALAKHLDQQGAYDDAFAHFARANAFRERVNRARRIIFDAPAHEENVDRIITKFTPAYFERVRGWGNDSELPIFIVGMPRSASTLVEQILASLCYGCAFEVKKCHEFQGGITRFQAFDCGPQVDDVTLDGALGIEALKDVVFQVDTEGASLALAVHGTGPTPLAAPATQWGEQVEVFEDTLDGQLTLQVCEVEPGAGRSF